MDGLIHKTTARITQPFAAILLSLFLPWVVLGDQPTPAWHTVNGNTVQFFKEKGFEFVVDDSMAHLYKKQTVEISILIPDRFTDSDFTNTFSSIAILSDELSADLETREHAGKKRTILAISEKMAQKAEVIFYFRNNRKNVTEGSMYRLSLAKVVEDWKKGKR